MLQAEQIAALAGNRDAKSTPDETLFLMRRINEEKITRIVCLGYAICCDAGMQSGHRYRCHGGPGEFAYGL